MKDLVCFGTLALALFQTAGEITLAHYTTAWTEADYQCQKTLN
jgi:hypothetical protein